MPKRNRNGSFVSPHLYDLALNHTASTSKSPPIFLEGITSDKAGNLYMVDIPYGRILRYSLIDLSWSEVCQWDGEPNGLALRDDGTLVVADYKQGIVSTDVLAFTIA